MNKQEAIIKLQNILNDDIYGWTDNIEKAFKMAIDSLQKSAQPKQKKGEWIRKKELVPLPWDCSPLPDDDYDAATNSVWREYYHCSNCDWKSGEFKGGNFCTNCGADMRGE